MALNKSIEELSQRKDVDRNTINFKQVSLLTRYIAIYFLVIPVIVIFHHLVYPFQRTYQNVTFVSFAEAYAFSIILSLFPVILYFASRYLKHLSNQEVSTMRNLKGNLVMALLLFGLGAVAIFPVLTLSIF